MPVRYLCLAGVVLTLAVTRSTAGNWTGDFWSHAAAVRELAYRPFAPTHPEIVSSAPALFNTPYVVAVAWFSRLLEVDAVTALATAGIVNLALLVCGVYRYIAVTFERPRETAFYALAFILLLWGSDAWLWSTFFHFESLFFVLPYPSTFAAASVLVMLATFVKWLRAAPAAVWTLLPGSAVLLLTHPVSAIVFAVGVSAHLIEATDQRKRFAAMALLTTAAMTPIVVAVLWPYYSFNDALTHRQAYDAANAEVYQAVLPRVWPVALLAPIALITRLSANKRDPVALMALMLTALYIFGGVTGQYSYGRVISFLLMWMQFLIAGQVADLEHRLRRFRRLEMRSAAYGALIVAVVATVLLLNGKRLVAVAFDRADWTSQYQFLRDYVGADDVVLSDLVSSYPVPSFAGKVVAHIGALPLVADRDDREAAVEQFFSAEATDAARLNTIDEFDVRWLLLPRDHPETESISALFTSRGTTVQSTDEFLLIRLAD